LGSLIGEGSGRGWGPGGRGRFAKLRGFTQPCLVVNGDSFVQQAQLFLDP